MAEILTYDGLITILPQFVNRSDVFLIDNLPLFIALAQRRIADDLPMLGLKVVTNGVLLPRQPYLVKDNQWLSTAYFQIGYNEPFQNGFQSVSNIYNRQETFCNEYWPDLSQLGRPKYYADVEYSQMLIVPVPDLPYPYKFTYYQIPVLIDSNNQQNYLTAYKPQLLIAACLIIIYGYLKDEDQGKFWKNEYDLALQSTDRQNTERLSDQQDTRG